MCYARGHYVANTEVVQLVRPDALPDTKAALRRSGQLAGDDGCPVCCDGGCKLHWHGQPGEEEREYKPLCLLKPQPLPPIPEGDILPMASLVSTNELLHRDEREVVRFKPMRELLVSPALAKLSPNTTLAQLKTLTPDDLEVRQRCPGGPGCAGLSQCRPTLPAGAGCHGRPDRCAVAGLPSGCEAGCALVLTASPPPPVAGAGREGVRQQAARHHHRRFDGACAPARA